MPKELSPETGNLLLAAPMMGDPNFRRSVVLLCEHSPEGSFGLILNRPLGVSLSEVLEGLEADSYPLYQGGPVQTDTLHFLHTRDDLVEGSIAVQRGIRWGGDFDALRSALSSGVMRPEHVRFFLGYAGWSGGQLEFEIEEGGWIVAPASENVVFSGEGSRLWRDVLRGMGAQYAMLANFPDDPRLN